jgi:hypothetical protein
MNGWQMKYPVKETAKLVKCVSGTKRVKRSRRSRYGSSIFEDVRDIKTNGSEPLKVR